METVYITGHRNPDSDSILSSLSYAALKNALGERQYVAARLGSVSDETQLILDRFNAEPPVLITNVRNQVRDLDYDTPPMISPAATISRASEAMQEAHIAVLPVVNEDGTLFGMLSAGDVANYDMACVHDPMIQPVPIYNVISVLEGKILHRGGEVRDTIAGEISIALPVSREHLLFSDKNSIVICGNQPKMLERALEIGVDCVIVCQAEVAPEILERAGDTCIIVTQMDAYHTVHLLCHSQPISHICNRNNKDMVAFHLDDYIADVENKVLESRFRAYPILDENEHVVGTLSRFHLLRPRRKRVILMDHNERAQSVPGLEEAKILEIIDHHRLADIETGGPIYMRNEPVGSTCTIVAGMYQEKGMMPTEKIAGLLAAGIVSDTVMFKSPTCTPRDIAVANRLARIADVSLDELGRAIFSATSSDDKTVQAMLGTDYKEFHIAGHSLAVSQITCMDSDRVLKRKDEFLDAMRENLKKRKLDTVVLMITDVLLEGTQLLFVGDDESIRHAFNLKADAGNCAFLPKIMSRKKQVIPTLSAMWG
ncbi:MAG: putative manganese-dependent inorganic diphosphatase [Oscillospiraceae bacterium]|nr:putative manganese-dependent inorganic diphosphatase [Oscillospiraceae bacterium]